MIEGINELAMVQNGNMSLLMVKVLQKTNPMLKTGTLDIGEELVGQGFIVIIVESIL